MKPSEIELPSNRKFGFFFTLIFLILTAYFYANNSLTWTYIFLVITVVFFLVTLVKTHFLTPLKILWMWLGLLMGIIIGPIVIGFIFFVIFTPIAYIMRVCGRDELGLKFKKRSSHWINRNVQHDIGTFKNQFWEFIMIELLHELWVFLRFRKKLWLAPIIFILLIFGGLLVVTQGSVLAPFIYTLF